MQFGTTAVKKQKMHKTLLTMRLKPKAKARVEIINTRPQVKQLFSEPPNLCLDMYLSFAYIASKVGEFDIIILQDAP